MPKILGALFGKAREGDPSTGALSTRVDLERRAPDLELDGASFSCFVSLCHRQNPQS